MPTARLAHSPRRRLTDSPTRVLDLAQTCKVSGGKRLLSVNQVDGIKEVLGDIDLDPAISDIANQTVSG